MSDPNHRLDYTIQHGLEVFAQRFGLGDILRPVIKRFVDDNVRTHRIPVTAEEIAEQMGLIKKQPKVKP